MKGINSFEDYITTRALSDFIAIPDDIKNNKDTNSINTCHHKIKSVRLVDDPEHRFYCILVNHCHNFAIDLEDNTGIVSYQSFSIIYGSSPYAVAQNYFNGDVAKAEHLFEAFYSAFPKLKQWMDEKHKEALSTGKVGTMTHRFLKMECDKKDRKDVLRMLRTAINAPVQSFFKNTRVLSLDGNEYTLGELSEQNKNIWVYAYDIEHQKIVLSKGLFAQCTGTTDTWYKITLDNNEEIQVTPEHLMMLRSGEYRRADQLNVGDSLMPIYLNKIERDINKGRLVFQETGELIYHWVHKQTYPNVDISKGHIHHINLNPSDNSPENLVHLSNSDHTYYHRMLYQICNDKQNDFYELEQYIMSVISKEYSQKQVDFIISNIKKFHRNLTLNQKIELASKSMTDRNRRRSEDYTDWYDNQRESARQEVSRRLQTTGNVLGISQEEYSRISKERYEGLRQKLYESHQTESARANHSRASKAKEQDPEYVFIYLRTQLVFLHTNQLPWETPEDWDRSTKQFPSSFKKSSKYILKFFDWDTYVSRAKEFLSDESNIEKFRTSEEDILNYKFAKFKKQIAFYDSNQLDYSTPELWDSNAHKLYPANVRIHSSKILENFTWSEFLKRTEEFINSDEYTEYSKSLKTVTGKENIFKQCKKLIAYLNEKSRTWSTPEEWDSNLADYLPVVDSRKSNKILEQMTWEEFIKMTEEFISDTEEYSKAVKKIPDHALICKTIFNYTKKDLGYYLQTNQVWNTPEDWDRGRVPRNYVKHSSEYILSYMTWNEFLELANKYVATYNHKIKSIEVIHLDKPEPKYDLHIPYYENFALSAGVFTHNSAASSVAAIVFCDVIQFMRSKHMKSKPICFIHDSLESDVYPYELIEVIEYQKHKLATGAMDYFGLALKADVSMGINMGEDIELDSLEILDKEKTKANLVLSGYKDEIENLLETWKVAYHKVDILEEHWNEAFIPLDQYYIPRKAFDANILATRYEGKCKIYIQYYTDDGKIDPVNKGEPNIHGTWDNFPLLEYIGKD